MGQAFTFRSLPPERQRLLRKMQQINFGRIKGMAIVDAQPVLEPLPEIVLDIKFGGDNGVRPEVNVTDFVLKSQVADMFDYFDRVRNFHIETLEIKNGLPFLMLVPQAAV